MVVHDVAFASPTRAAVLYNLTLAMGNDMTLIGYAVLIDGAWNVSRQTPRHRTLRGPLPD